VGGPSVRPALFSSQWQPWGYRWDARQRTRFDGRGAWKRPDRFHPEEDPRAFCHSSRVRGRGAALSASSSGKGFRPPCGTQSRYHQRSEWRFIASVAAPQIDGLAALWRAVSFGPLSCVGAPNGRERPDLSQTVGVAAGQEVGFMIGPLLAVAFFDRIEWQCWPTSSRSEAASWPEELKEAIAGRPAPPTAWGKRAKAR
jgi:hypothetical protein